MPPIPASDVPLDVATYRDALARHLDAGEDVGSASRHAAEDVLSEREEWRALSDRAMQEGFLADDAKRLVERHLEELDDFAERWSCVVGNTAMQAKSRFDVLVAANLKLLASMATEVKAMRAAADASEANAEEAIRATVREMGEHERGAAE